MSEKPPAELTPSSVPGVIFWFRNDLRLHDSPALLHAIACARRLQTWLLPVHVHDTGMHALTPWGFARTGAGRRAWIAMALDDLSEQLRARGSLLLQMQGRPESVLSELVRALGHPLLVCEDISAPQELAQVQALRRSGVVVQTVWQSSLMDPQQLPFAPENVPDQFTAFRQALERHGVKAAAPVPAPQELPPAPDVRHLPRSLAEACRISPQDSTILADPHSAFPWDQPDFHGGERAALAHLARYCDKGLPHSYKATRNGLYRTDDSTKWSPWLATGALSARQAWAAIDAFEREHGGSESTYWIGFELLWRDHFRWLHRKHGLRLYRAQGLKDLPAPHHDAQAFDRWRQGRTGQEFIDAGMRELATTGYLSNRMRQNVASYLVHDLQCDWRAGAAWFEACLIDYDVYSNQGNWLYLSGRGTDPRGSRRFNPVKQAQDYDPDHKYRGMWLPHTEGSLP